MRSSFRSILLALIPLSASCSQPSSPTPKADGVRLLSEAIQGGYPSSDHAVVGIYRLQGASVVAGCTGSLIAPNLVLTARHCVAQLPSSSPTCGSAAFGATFPASQFVVFNDQSVSSTTFYYGVAEVRVAPGSNDICGYDVALLILSQSFAAATATPIVPRVFEQPHFNEAYSAVGYGKTCASCTDGGAARNRLDGLSVQCVGSCGNPDYASDQEWWGDDGVCSGDSGGPALDGQGRVIGVASRAGTSGNSCVGAIYERVDSHSDFIIQAALDAASSGGYAAPAWADPDGGTGGSTQTCGDCANSSVVPGAGCSNAYDDCVNAPDCVAFANCAQGCTTSACQTKCYVDHPSGALLYGAINDCVCDVACANACATECAIPSCGFTVGDPTCSDCFQQQCCSLGETCAGSTPCLGLVICFNGCGTDQACLNNCAAGYAAGVTDYEAMVACLDGPCGPSCGGGGSAGAAGAGGTGGSGTGGAAGTAGGAGMSGAAGAAGSGGASGAAGLGGGGSGGMAGQGGGAGSGGTSSVDAGLAGSGGAAAGSGGAPPSTPTDLVVDDGSGCGCRIAPRPAAPVRDLFSLLAILGIAFLRRRTTHWNCSYPDPERSDGGEG